MLKQIVVLSLSVLISLPLMSQHEKGNFQIRAGLGLGAYATESTTSLKIGNNTIQNSDNSGAVTAIVPIDFLYGVSNRFSLGLSFGFGNYLQDTTTVDTQSNRIRFFGLTGEYYFVNRSAFNMSLFLSAHATSLVIYDKVLQGDFEYSYSGGGTSLGLGANIFLFPAVAVNLRLAYDARNLNLNEWKINNNSQDLSNLGVNLNNQGVQFTLGLTIKI
jgi:hypothetical protein